MIFSLSRKTNKHKHLIIDYNNLTDYDIFTLI